MQKAYQNRSFADLWTFLGLLAAGSLLLYLLILHGGGLSQSGFLVLGLMWVPGISAILTVLIHKRPMKSLGWRPGKPQYQVFGYVLPLLYSLIAYGFIWSSGLGIFNREALPSATVLLFTASLGVLFSLISALGEEIGWRGYFFMRLCEIMTFRKAVAISGVVWLLWHTPLILFSDYNAAGTPVWYSWLCFAVMLLGINFAFSWLRLKSCSLWPAALMHASHNLFIQKLFDPLTLDSGYTAWFSGEFGLALALMGIFVAVFFDWLATRQ